MLLSTLRGLRHIQSRVTTIVALREEGLFIAPGEIDTLVARQLVDILHGSVVADSPDEIANRDRTIIKARDMVSSLTSDLEREKARFNDLSAEYMALREKFTALEKDRDIADDLGSRLADQIDTLQLRTERLEHVIVAQAYALYAPDVTDAA